MVSNASEDLPEPESPVMTVRALRGSATEMFLRLCSRAPRTLRNSWGIRSQKYREARRHSTLPSRFSSLPSYLSAMRRLRNSRAPESDEAALEGFDRADLEGDA